MQYTTCYIYLSIFNSCFIRISKILLYAIHNITHNISTNGYVVLSGFQRYFCMQYTTESIVYSAGEKLFYQDFKDTFVCNTQHVSSNVCWCSSCFIRISKILLYAIHNGIGGIMSAVSLFYQDFKDTFVCNTQLTKRNNV